MGFTFGSAAAVAAIFVAAIVSGVWKIVHVENDQEAGAEAELQL